jgi:hypothetical protein
MLAQTLLPYAPILGLVIVVVLGIMLRGKHRHAH